MYNKPKYIITKIDSQYNGRANMQRNIFFADIINLANKNKRYRKCHRIIMYICRKISFQQRIQCVCHITRRAGLTGKV